MTLGEKIAQLRTERKLTQEELAKFVGISRSAVSLYEINKREPDIKTIRALASFFEISLDELFDYNSKTINQPDFSEAFKEKNLGDAILRIVNICAEFDLSNEIRMQMIDKAVKNYGLPGGPNCGAGDEAAHGPKKPGSGVLDNE